MRCLAVMALAISGPWVTANVVPRLTESMLVGGMAIAASARAYQPATLFEAIDEVRKGGGRLIELEFGQPLSPADPSVEVRDDLTEADMDRLRRKLGVAGVRPVGARVRFSNNESANNRLFQWADTLEIPVLIGDVSSLDQLDQIERLIRRYNISVGIPLGGARGGDAPDVARMLDRVRGRDPRLGVVVDIRELLRAGLDPFEVITTLRSRLLGIRLSDVSSVSRTARPAPFGTGRFDFRRLLVQLDEERFDGYLVLDWPPGEGDFREDLRNAIRFVGSGMDGIRRENLLRIASRSATVAEGLRYEVLLQGEIPEPVHVAAAPDGTIWFAGRRGHVWTWNEGHPAPRLVARLGVVTTGQRGLHAFVFDPGFLTNGFLYVYRSPMVPSGNWNRVARFTARRADDRWTLDVDSEKVLLEIPSAYHGQGQGGGLLLHPVERTLYIGSGDNNLPNETPRFFDDPANGPQDLGSLWGKILRIRLDGSIPPDNPFANHAGARPEVYSLGLRNPVTLSFNPATGDVLAGDVGYDRRLDFEEVNIVRPGANYGWPRCDGRGLDTLAGTECPVPDAVAPWFSYPHGSAAAVVVGPVLVGESARHWPSPHGLVYGDFARRSVRWAVIDSSTGLVTNTVPLVSSLGGGPLSICHAPDGALYMVEYAGWLTGNPQDRLSRLVPVSVEADASGTIAPARDVSAR